MYVTCAQWWLSNTEVGVEILVTPPEQFPNPAKDQALKSLPCKNIYVVMPTVRHLYVEWVYDARLLL